MDTDRGGRSCLTALGQRATSPVGHHFSTQSHKHWHDHLMPPAASDDEPSVLSTLSAAEPRALNLHAKLLLEDAEVDELRTALEADTEFQWYCVDLDSQSILEVERPNPEYALNAIVRRRPRSAAAWKPFLSESLGLPLQSTEETTAESALVVARTTRSARHVLWCFGAASLAVPNELVDRRFGLIAALNKHTTEAHNSWRSTPPNARKRKRQQDAANRVRQLDADARSGYQHTFTAKSASGSPVHGLGFDTVSDLLKKLRVVTDDELMPDIEGGTGIRFNTYCESWNDFIILADYLLDLRNRRSYEAEWYWVDHVVPVTPRAKVDRLLTDLYSQISRDGNLNIDLMLPDIEETDGTPCQRLQFGIGQEDPIHSPVQWDHVRRRLLHLQPTSRPLRREIKIRPDPGDTESTVRRPISDLLVAEFEEAGQHYILSDGELLSVDLDFIERLNCEVSQVPWSNFPFPPYGGGNERGYLEDAADSDRITLLDQENIYLPNETAVEPCDLLTDDGRLVYAKLKGASSTFSHLCTQADTAAELLRRHPEARDQLLDRVSQGGAEPKLQDAALQAMGYLEARATDAVTVTLLLLGAWRVKELSSLPLLTKVRLLRSREKITDLGYRFEVASPPIVPFQRSAAQSRRRRVPSVPRGAHSS